MKNLIYKDFRLSIHPFFLIFPVLISALMMIPQWIYLLVPLYFCLISAPNLLAQYRANNDISFSAILPVSKEAIVTSRILSFILIELEHLFFLMLFIFIHNWAYSVENFGLNPNPALLGTSFILYGVFNLVLFPVYFRTAYKYGFSVILASLVVLILAAPVEVLAMINPVFQQWMEYHPLFPWLVLAGGIVCFILANLITIKLSVKRFMRVDL